VIAVIALTRQPDSPRIAQDKLGETVWKAPEMVDSPGIDLDTNELESMFSLSPDKVRLVAPHNTHTTRIRHAPGSD
jgi:hypothetical protein